MQRTIEMVEKKGYKIVVIIGTLRRDMDLKDCLDFASGGLGRWLVRESIK